jgi:hypothetical protein
VNGPCFGTACKSAKIRGPRNGENASVVTNSTDRPRRASRSSDSARDLSYDFAPGANCTRDQALWRRAEEIFHAALERPPEIRLAFVGEACRGRLELLELVSTLLSNDRGAGGFLDPPALASLGPPSSTADSSPLGRQ